MMERFTDHARAAVRAAFRRRHSATEREIVDLLVKRRRELAVQMLNVTRVSANDLPVDATPVAMETLVIQAEHLAEQAGDRHVGTEHLLLAMASLPGSTLAAQGASPDRLAAALSAITAPRRPAHPPLARRAGALCRSAWQWMRRRV